MARTAKRIATAAIAAAVAGICLGATPAISRADDLAELQAKVEEANVAYDEAVAHAEELQGQITENEAKIAQIEEQLPGQRARAAESLKTLYKMQQSSGGLIDLILSSDDFNEFISTIAYLERIQTKNLVELQNLADLNAELQEAKDTLAARHAQAVQEQEAAQQAQQDAIAARDDIVQQALKQAAAEEAQAQAAIEKAQQEAAAGASFTNASGVQTKVTVVEDTTSIAESIADTSATSTSSSTSSDSASSSSSSSDSASSSSASSDSASSDSASSSSSSSSSSSTSSETSTGSARDQFVAKWAPRIDAYLSGSPLSGYGTNFADAAYRYGVDPRLSPAISCVESGKGAICFRSHNAWGWGSSSWGSWEAAIEGHVSGLAAGGYYTLTMEGASRYCPPGDEWYAAVLGQINCI